MSSATYTPEFLQLVARARSVVRGISVPHFAALPGDEQPLLIDVREDREWRTGRAEGRCI